MSFIRFTLLAIIGFLLINSSTVEAQEIHSGKNVVRAMFEKYEGKWYEYLTFEQKTTFYGPKEEVQRTQTWYEAMHIPGNLAIKFDEKLSGNGILFRNDVQYGFANGQMIQEIKRVHELLILGFDVYGQLPDSTFKQLQQAGYNLDKMYEDEWQGRAAYVVGVNKPQADSAQFWIDKEHLYFVRSISIGRENSIQEVQFNKYEQLGEGWIAPEVIFLANGQKGLLEEYTDISIPDTLSAEIFDPEKFTEVGW